jgi:hypothetical protein
LYHIGSNSCNYCWSQNPGLVTSAKVQVKSGPSLVKHPLVSTTRSRAWARRLTPTARKRQKLPGLTISFSSANYFLASSFTGLVSTWNGLKILTLPVNGRCTFFGSRHESEQTPPHPNSNVLV